MCSGFIWESFDIYCLLFSQYLISTFFFNFSLLQVFLLLIIIPPHNDAQYSVWYSLHLNKFSFPGVFYLKLSTWQYPQPFLLISHLLSLCFSSDMWNSCFIQQGSKTGHTVITACLHVCLHIQYQPSNQSIARWSVTDQINCQILRQ